MINSLNINVFLTNILQDANSYQLFWLFIEFYPILWYNFIILLFCASSILKVQTSKQLEEVYVELFTTVSIKTTIKRKDAR